jgi:hypothetical protein
MNWPIIQIKRNKNDVPRQAYLKFSWFKGPHIHFEADNKAQTGLYHGHPALFINAKLLKKISRCPNCGFADCLVKDGHKTVNLKLSHRDSTY